MRVYYSDDIEVPLPPGHRFPMRKYRLLREALLRQAVLKPSQLCAAPLATRAQLLRAHTSAYVSAVLDGSLDESLLRRLGFPWSEALVVRSLASVGGALAAARDALRDGLAGNLAGGTHHACADAGEGFCVFNDMAVAALDLIATGLVRRVAVVDLDVHQGNGNSAILAGRPHTFVFSMHGQKNYPFCKVASTLDIALPDGTTDQRYLQALGDALPKVLAWGPDLVLYQAGVDPLAQDKLGRLALSMEGLAQRDRMVLDGCMRAGIPVSLALGGGYAEPIELSVAAHAQTYAIAASLPRSVRTDTP